MVCAVGFEPTASHFQGEVSTRLTYTQIVWHPGRDSNPDQQFWRLVCCHYTTEIYLVPHDRIELPYSDYKTDVIPLYE